MILYVAGPMTGLPDLNYPRFFDVQAKLEKHGFEVRNPATVDDEYREVEHSNDCDAPCLAGMRVRCKTCTPRDWVWYMRRSILMMLEADGVATIEGWQASRGARAEVELARALEVRVMPWTHWITLAVLRKKVEARKAEEV